MGKKCEWKDGKFEPCDGYNSDYRYMHPSCGTVTADNVAHGWKYCPFCGADIRKPEPEVIIKRSGETWVARYDAVDYLYCHQGSVKEPYFLTASTKVPRVEWKPISEIEITDEIAKLRPMVKQIEGHEIKKLIAVPTVECRLFQYKVISRTGMTDGWNDCRLATVKDLS